MDQNDDQPQSLGICHRLYYFITKTLAINATKPVTLGEPSHCDPIPVVKKELENDGDGVILVEEVENDDGKSSNGASLVEEKTGENDVCTSLQLRVAKKMVSIKDEAEVIDLGKKRKRFSFDKQMSMKKKECDVELRPLKSILRVGSNQK